MTEYRRPKTEDLRPQTEYGFRSSTLKNDRILLESSAVRQVPHATAPFMRYVYIAAYTHFELFISTAFVAFDPRPSETIEIRGRFSCVLLYNSVFLCSFGSDSDPYDMRSKHYGTTPMTGEDGKLNNEWSI